MEQNLEALELANEVRMARARVKRALRAGTISLSEAMSDPSTSTMQVYDLLRARSYWGPKRINNALFSARVGRERLVRSLTPGERRRLCEMKGR